jgi:rare lipoprotein A
MVRHANHGTGELSVRRGTKSPPLGLMRKRRRGFEMSRVTFVLVGTLFAAALPVQATAQSAHHGFSGLCAYYPAHGNGLTAAHRTLPFGTRVRVSDPKTGRNVTVTINDRGPFGKHRVPDLSPSAARALGMISRGVIYVKAEVL